MHQLLWRLQLVHWQCNMRYLRQQNINRRAPFDQRLYVDMTDSIIMNSLNHLLLPKGSTGNRPASTTWTEGMIRYNTSTHEVEVYQGIGGAATWRSLRFKESVGIVQQTLGIGDYIETIFGPLNPAPPTIVESGSTWTGSNLIVLVENVIQIYNTNFSVVTDPPGFAEGTYLEFDSPVPDGKVVIVLHNFDK